MLRELGVPCKKRQHPDGHHLSYSTPKRLLSISEAELDSSIDSVRDFATPKGSALNDASHGSLWNSTSSAVITSDYSTSMGGSHSTMSAADVASPKHSSLRFTHSSHTPSDAASYNPESSNSAKGSPTHKGIWMYRSATSVCEQTASDEDFSEVTDAHTSMSVRESGGVHASGKVTHVISRREKSSLNPKRGMDEAWFKDGYGDYVFQEKRVDSNSSFYSKSQRREHMHPSIACESSSRASGDSLMGAVKSRQGLSHTYGSACTMSSREILPGLGSQERREGVDQFRRSERLDQFRTQGHLGSELDSHSYPPDKGKMEENSPAYVLSSGRLSLEEEARLGYRAPTIDHDFEEYFSSLML